MSKNHHCGQWSLYSPGYNESGQLFNSVKKRLHFDTVIYRLIHACLSVSEIDNVIVEDTDIPWHMYMSVCRDEFTKLGNHHHFTPIICRILNVTTRCSRSVAQLVIVIGCDNCEMTTFTTADEFAATDLR